MGRGQSMDLEEDAVMDLDRELPSLRMGEQRKEKREGRREWI